MSPAGQAGARGQSWRYIMEGTMKAARLNFTLGMITAFCITGAFEAAQQEPLMQINLPWWLYANLAIAAIGLAIFNALGWE